VLVLNDVPTWRGGRRNFILPFIRDGFLESLLSSNPFLTKLGPICLERNDLEPPSPC